MFRAIKKFVLKDIVLEIKDIRSLEHLRSLSKSYMPWTGASIHPTALMYLLNDIILHQRKHIVECGSGISTIMIASLLKANNHEARFCSIDHDEQWIGILKDQLERLGVANYVEFVHAPLSSTDGGWDGVAEWYDTQIIDQNMESEPIDLLFIDGPPANKDGNKHSRYPALPYFATKVSDSATIILDDSCRNAETQIAERWNNEFRLNMKQEILKGDIFLHTRSNRFNVL